jgi:4-diphosphocytidyl-2-C-methyl-D-erythritol kinase
LTRKTTVPAFAKLNLTLGVLAKRPDGYHDIESVMLRIGLRDNVSVALTDGAGIAVRSSARHIPNDERNTAYKAAAAFFERTGTRFRAGITLAKHIPVGAGLGGGSADAAAVLTALNALTGSGLSEDELAETGASVGSDVPFCVVGGTCLAEGRGELLTRLPAFPDCRIVVVKPSFSVSTATLFAAIDETPLPAAGSGKAVPPAGRPQARARNASADKARIAPPDNRAMLAAIGSGSLEACAAEVRNVFEDALPGRYAREIAAVKRRLVACGALTASMTGTGSAVFALFADEFAARNAYSALRREYRETFLTACS